MKRYTIITVLLTVILNMVGVDVLAYNIKKTNTDGVTIYYNWNNDKTELSVTYNGSSPYNSKTYSGNVVIPESVEYEGKIYNVTSIGDMAFIGCDGLYSVTIPNSVKSIGEEAFRNCFMLNSLTIGNNLETIGEGAFVRCMYLTSVTLPNSVTFIGKEAFFYCGSLNSINIPYGVKSIEYGMFYGCSALKSITLPYSVTSIGEMAFWDCSSLTSVIIPSSVTTIGDGAFGNCSLLSSVNVTISDYSSFCKNSVVGLISSTSGIPVKLIDTEGNEIKNYVIPNDVTSIGDKAFYNCNGLVSVIIDSGIISIGDKAFYNCNGLMSVIMGSDIRYIGNYTFSKCTNLTDVYCYAKSVPNTSSVAFAQSNINARTLHVLKASLDDYKQTLPWKSFGKIVAINVSEYTLTYNVDGNVYKQFSYNEGDAITPEPDPTKEGYTFSGWSNIPATMPAHDVTVTGTFSVNKYKLTYTVDGLEYKYYYVECGSAITPEAAPTKEGYTFSGWSNIPATMPTHDVTVTGAFTKDALPRCATPIINFCNDELSFSCATQGVEFVSVVTVSDAKKYYDAKIKLAQTYKVTVYATKNGYERSDIATKEIVITNDNTGSAEVLTGDVNGDGVVNVADHVKLSDIIKKSK